MYFDRTYLAALIGLSTALFCGQARAQSADSTSQNPTRIEVASANNPAKPACTPIRIRCASTIPASRSPLFVVDGKVVEEHDIKSLNPNDIDKIDILKGAAATGVYGSRAANGVVLISMKHRGSKYMYQPEAKKGRLD
jgi:TonB-dependent SusC/RagA subfamily outer membrane receptor